MNSILLLTLSICILLCISTVISTNEPSIPSDGMKQLQMVQALWRHGDRSPGSSFASDPITPDYWDFGGGGLGELTPLGMTQLMEMGGRLRKRYVDTGFLSKYYNSREIYVHSTPFNRTMISAMANMIGMYSQGAQPFQQIPQSDSTNNSEVAWPGFFVPIPVHTKTKDNEHVGLVDGPCKRQDALWNLVLETKEFKEFLANPNTTFVLDALSKGTGEENMNVNRVRALYDIFNIEIFHNLTDKMAPFWDKTLMEKMDFVNDRTQDFFDALPFRGSLYRGVDLYTDIAKIRIGELVTEMVDRFLLKQECEGKKGGACDWINQLKYHAISAHDSALFAYGVALGAEKTLFPDGSYPTYASSILTELWTDTADGGKQYIKLVYSSGDRKPYAVVTSAIKGCDQFPVYCPIEVITGIANKIRSPTPVTELCEDTKVPPGDKDDPSKSSPTISSIFLCFLVSSLSYI